MKRKIFFRADGNSNTGLGHVMRSCALISMLKEDFDCHFFIQEPMASLITTISMEGSTIHPLDKTSDYQAEAKELSCALHPNDIIVLDGYSFDTNYQKIFKEKGCKVICIDDICAYHFVADLVINHGPGILASDYSVERFTQLLLGPSYTLVNTEFLESARRMRQVDSLNKCLVCFGGTDFNNVTLKILRFVKKLNLDLELDVIIGTAYQGQRELESFIVNHRDIRLHYGIPQHDVMALMKQSDIMICAASTILYEACSVGMGILAGYFVDNQERIYHGFTELECIWSLNDLNKLNESKFHEAISSITVDKINAQILKQKQIIDGFSNNRLKETITAL